MQLKQWMKHGNLGLVLSRLALSQILPFIGAANPASGSVAATIAHPAHTTSVPDFLTSVNDAESTIAYLTNFVNTSQMARRVVPARLPNGPNFYSFPDQNTLNAAASGFLSAFELALAGLKVAWCPPTDESDMDESYTRYFESGEVTRQTVMNVLLAILGPGGIGPLMMKDPQYPLDVWYNFNSGPNFKIDTRACMSNTNLNAVTVMWPLGDLHGAWYNPSMTWIDICPRAFTRFPTPLREIECEDLGTEASNRMLNLGALFLHELTHWARLTMDAAGIATTDYAYGSGNCQALQEHYDEHRSPVNNADSYTWFCLEAYFSEKCSIDFRDRYDSDSDDNTSDFEVHGFPAGEMPPTNSSP